MSKRIDSDIYSFYQLKDMVSVLIPVLSKLGISDLCAVKSFPPNDKMYAYFISTSGEITDRIRYKYNGIDCDHVVCGDSLLDIYNDLNYMTVNYIFGYVS